MRGIRGVQENVARQKLHWPLARTALLESDRPTPCISAAERRQILAHGASHGGDGKRSPAPVGA